MHWSTEDWHTAGEPFRIVEGVPTHGATVAERRMEAMDGDADAVRRFLCLEPRGHDDMYGGFITPADDDGADFGVLFWHKDGFSTACGHGTMALGAWAVRTGLVDAPDGGETVVTIDVPSGRVQARVQRSAGQTTGVIFRNVACRVLERGIRLATSRGDVDVDLVFGGAVYATLPAEALGLSVTPADTAELTRLGREIKWALDEHPAAQLDDPRLSGVYGTILVDDLGRTHSGPCARAAWGRSSNSANIDVMNDDNIFSGDFGTSRSTVRAMLYGYYETGSVRLTPTVELIYAQETQKDFAVTDGVDTTVVTGVTNELARLSISSDIEYPIAFGHGSAIFFATPKLNWTYNSDGLGPNTQQLSGALEVGIKTNPGEKWRGEAAIAYDGLGQSGFDAVTIRALVSVNF